MKRLLSAAVLAATTVPALAGGVSIGVGQPGFYGQINIGGMPQPPQVINQQPILVQQPMSAYPQQPVYLRVPPQHQENWHRHCQQYNACGQPVYFVHEQWYNNTFGGGQGRQYGHEDGRGEYHEHGRGEYREDGRGEYREHGRGEYREDGRGEYRERGRGEYREHGRGEYREHEGYREGRRGGGGYERDRRY